MSTDQPSSVIETLPGAACLYDWVYLYDVGTKKLAIISSSRCMLNKFIVKAHPHIMRSGKVKCSGFGSHWYQGIQKCNIIGKCKGLWFLGRSQFCVSCMKVKTDLIVVCNQLGYRSQCIFSCGIMRAYHGCKVQQLQLLSFYHSTPYCCLFFFFHYIPKFAWNNPMVDRYVCLFTLLLVKSVMLTNVLAAKWVSTLVECLLTWQIVHPPWRIQICELIWNLHTCIDCTINLILWWTYPLLY